MTTQTDASSVQQVPCEVCLREIPKSEATVSEASDYFLYFCGLECFSKWKTGDDKPKPPDRPAS